MPTIRKQRYTYYADASGKKVSADTPGAKLVRKESAKYYGYGVPNVAKGKGVPLCEDKRAAQQMLAALVANAARGLVGLPDPGAMGGKIADHVEAYRAWLVGRGTSAKQVRYVVDSVRRTAAAAGWQTPASLIAPGAAMALERAVAAIPGASPQRRARRLSIARGFGRWLFEDAEILPRHPFPAKRRRRTKAGGKPKVIHGRRPPLPEELAKLIQTARDSPRVARSLDGPARAVLYATAAGTGLRASELAALTTGSFDLDADYPAVSLPGEHTKNGEDARIPLSPGLAAMLRAFLPTRPPGKVWPGDWPRRGGDVIVKDLADAGIQYRHDTPTGTYYTDLHSLRHYFATHLISTGAPVKAAQALMRHSTPMLTVGTYSHTTDRETAEAVARVPLGPTAAAAPGPFAGMSRADLERAAEGLLAVVGCLTPWLTDGAGGPCAAEGGQRRRNRRGE